MNNTEEKIIINIDAASDKKAEDVFLELERLVNVVDDAMPELANTPFWDMFIHILCYFSAWIFNSVKEYPSEYVKNKIQDARLDFIMEIAEKKYGDTVQ